MKLWNNAKCSRIPSPVLVMGWFCIRAATAMLEIEVEHDAMSTLTIYLFMTESSNFKKLALIQILHVSVHLSVQSTNSTMNWCLYFLEVNNIYKISFMIVYCCYHLLFVS